MLVRKKWLANFLIILCFIFFSLPMILVCGFPWSYKWYYMYGIGFLATLLDALTVISPWALLLNGCHLLQEGIETSNVYCYSPILLGCFNRIVCDSIPPDIRASTLVGDSASPLIPKYSDNHR